MNASNHYVGISAGSVQLDEGERINADHLRFVTVNLIACLFLQRFGLIAGGSEFFLCFVVFIASACWIVARGSGELRPEIVLLFLLVAVAFTTSTLLGFLLPRSMGTLSVTSLIGVLLFNTVFLFGPRAPDAAEQSLRLFLSCARIICVLGIVQYSLQFAGIRIFTLGDILPFLRPVLVEGNYNTEGILEWGSTLQRANGIVLLEPGAFSQVIAIAVVVDVFVRRSFRFLPLYGVAYVLSFSGTGLLSLVLALAISTVIVGGQRKYVVLSVVLGVPFVLALWFVFPDDIGKLLKRSTEFSTPGTSGYLRYVAQAQAWEYFSQGWRSLLGTGPGAYERSPVYVVGSASAAVKIFAEYGLLGLTTFGTYLIVSMWNHRYALLSVMMLVVYQFGGGNLLQPPTLILMALLCIWTRQARPVVER